MNGHDSPPPGAVPKPLRPDAKIRLVGHGPFFGPGVARLLEEIEQAGSVRTACAAMDMSYSKAWKILRGAERELGYPLVERRQGGAHGGAALLTAQGRELLTRYRAFERESREAVEAVFRRHF